MHDFDFTGPAALPRLNFSAAIGLAQQTHRVAAISGADLFSQLRLDAASIARELPSLANEPLAPPGYSAVPAWKVWQDF